MHIYKINVYGFDDLKESVRNEILATQMIGAKELAHNSVGGLFKTFLAQRGFCTDDIRWELGDGPRGVAFYGQPETDRLVGCQSTVRAVFAKAVALIEARPGDTERDDLDRIAFYVYIGKRLPHSDNCASMRVCVELDNYDDDPEILDPYTGPPILHWSGNGDPPEGYGLTDLARELELVVLDLCAKYSHELETLGVEQIQHESRESVCLEYIRSLGEIFTQDGAIIEEPLLRSLYNALLHDE